MGLNSASKKYTSGLRSAPAVLLESPREGMFSSAIPELRSGIWNEWRPDRLPLRRSWDSPLMAFPFRFPERHGRSPASERGRLTGDFFRSSLPRFLGMRRNRKSRPPNNQQRDDGKHFPGRTATLKQSEEASRRASPAGSPTGRMVRRSRVFDAHTARVEP